MPRSQRATAALWQRELRAGRAPLVRGSRWLTSDVPEWRVGSAPLPGARRTGEMLKAMQKAMRGPDSAGQGSQRATPDHQNKTLEELGISKTQSSRWQQLAPVRAGVATW